MKEAIISIVSFGLGILVGFYLLKPKIQITTQVVKCPAAVSVSQFDLTKLNNKKGNFTYAPTYDNVTIIYCDSIKK